MKHKEEEEKLVKSGKGSAGKSTKQAANGDSKKKNKKDAAPSSRRSIIPSVLLITSTLVVLIAVASIYMCKTEDSCFGLGGVIKDLGRSARFSYLKYFHGSKKKSSSQDQDEEDGEGKVSELPWMKGPVRNARVFTTEEIKYVENGPLYLVIVGHVFDVTAGKTYYAPGTGYFGFIGKDGSRAFITGEFNEEGLTDDVEGLSHSDYLGLANWIKFYFEKYNFKGYLVGRFFDETGKETEYMGKLKKWVKLAELNDEAEQDLRKLFPPCNAQWNADDGSLLWCTNQSGGIKRDWVGVPRRFFEKQNEKPRCACVHPNLLADPRIRTYENCDPKSVSCRPPKEED